MKQQRRRGTPNEEAKEEIQEEGSEADSEDGSEGGYEDIASAEDLQLPHDVVAQMKNAAAAREIWPIPIRKLLYIGSGWNRSRHAHDKFIRMVRNRMESGSARNVRKAQQLWEQEHKNFLMPSWEKLERIGMDVLFAIDLRNSVKGRIVLCVDTDDYKNATMNMVIRLGENFTSWEILVTALLIKYELNVDYIVQFIPSAGATATLTHRAAAPATSHCASGASRSKKKCANCNKKKTTDRDLFKCSRCQKVRYCGTICQLKHWSSTHKKECTPTTTTTQGAAAAAPPPPAERGKPHNCTKLLLRKLHESTDEAAIAAFFAFVDSNVKTVEWLRDKKGVAKKAVVEFENAQACDKAATLNGAMLLGRHIEIVWAD